jgi:hypothetical protein
MVTYTISLTNRFININNIANPNIFLEILYGDFFPVGTYTISLTPVSPINNNTFNFTHVVTLPNTINDFLVTNRTWTTLERGYYKISVSFSNLGDTFNLLNDNFYVYSKTGSSCDVAIVPETFDIQPNVATTKLFTLYKVDLNPSFSSTTYTLTLTESLLGSTSFSGSTFSSGNPIYISVPNIILQDPFTPYSFNASLSGGNDCTYQFINGLVHIQTLCFIESTKILTLHDGYIPVQHLEPGTLIKTYGTHKFLPLKNLYKTKINYKKTNHKLNKLYKYDKYKFGLIEDLVVSGGHSVLVDELNDNEKKLTNQFWNEHEKIENKYKLLVCIDSRNTEFEQEGIYNMYQIVLESDDENKQFEIYANGILTETMSIAFYNRHQ